MAMKVSIIIPVYNEEKTIARLVNAVKAVDLRHLKLAKEIIVVDDGSTDGSGEIISGMKGIRVLRHPKNRGKGAAVRTGIENSSGGIIFIQDADLEYNPKQMPKLLEPIVKGGGSVVYGSRRLGVLKGRSMILHDAGNWLLSFVTSALFGCRVTDMETGYKVFRREVVKGMKLESNRFDFEPEITAKILKKGYRIHEVPIEFSPRGFGEGKKITLWDGVMALGALIKYRWFA